jgi:hypothetical protein
MTAAFALAITAIMLLACGGLIWYSRDSAQRNADALLSSAAEKASRELGDTDEPGESVHALHEQAEELTAIGLVMLVVDAHGRTVLQSQRNIPSPPYINNHKWRITTFPVDGNTCVIGMPWTRTDDALEYHSMLLIVLGLFVVIVASIGAWA